MPITQKLFRILLAATLAGVPTALMAESASPTGDAADFLAASKSYDPSASGAKLFGNLTVVFSKETRSDCRTGNCIDGSWVKNAYIGLTMESGNVRLPFTTDYMDGPFSDGPLSSPTSRPGCIPLDPAPASPPAPLEKACGFWLNSNSPALVEVMLTMVKRKVIPFFYRCTFDVPGSCPGFKVKAISNFQYTTGLPLVAKDPLFGGFSADITLAVQ